MDLNQEKTKQGVGFSDVLIYTNLFFKDNKGK